ncbi:MAG TPA: SHD1 domain-containing protein, partial [Pirellulaceae bacterium]|nr:SHD1 domain-containing protein [Pirellulaceae bacterium]
MPATNIPVSLPASVQAATGNQATPVAGTSASPPGAGFSAPGFPNSRFPPADFGSSLPESARPTRERPETFTARRNGPEFPPDTRTAGQAAELTPGLDIWALWGTRVWYRSRVVSLEGDQVRVHYIGWPNASDDTLPIANIRIVVGEAPAANSPAASSAPAAATARTWSDSSGQFKIDAEFVSLEGDMVTLRKTDGKAIRLPIGKLSQADQAVARELAASQ